MERRLDYAIDVDAIAASRKGGKKVPQFVLNLIKKMIHQDYMNEYITRGYEGEEFCRKCLEYIDVKVDIEGLENLDLLPEGEHCTIISNHPLGGIDGVAILGLISDKFNGIRLLANDFLMALKGLAPLCVPINKMGSQARTLRQSIERAFDSENEMLVFPAGKCSRKIDGVIQDTEWKKTFLKESIRTGRYIVPIHFIAQNSKRFYRVDALCRLFRIKLNIPMFLLPDELYRAQHSRFKMIIGKPVAPSTFDQSRSIVEWVQWLRDLTYSL